MKKIISLIICLSLLCSFVTAPVRAESDVPSEAAETLVALGILEGASNGDLMLGKVLTRAEFVTMLTRALKADFGSTTVYFDDVDANHWAVASIAVACEMGFVKGVDERTFLPDTPLAFEEAVKMLVASLGYEPVAARKGGYPSGYLTVAQNIGLLDGISGTAGLIVRRDMAAEMLFNALDCKVVVDTGVGEEIASVTEKGVTLLSEKMKIEKGEGIVFANDVTSLSNAGGVNRGQVRIGDRVFYAETTGAENLLGYAVTYYADCSDNDEVQELIYVRPDERENTVTKVFASDILPETTTQEFVYLNEDDETEEIDISIYADLIYNGASVGGFTKADMVPSYGYVEIIDNDRDGESDVLFVYDLETIIVGEVSSTKFKAIDYKDSLKSVELDPDSKDYSFAIYQDGAEVDFSAIKVGTTLSVAISKNIGGKKQITVEISDETATGNLSALGDDTAIIDDVEYKVKNETLSNELKSFLNRDIMVYIDSLGMIAGIDEAAEASFKYGYLIDYNTNGRFAATTRLKILEANSNVSVLNCAKKVSLDGAAAKETSLVISDLAVTKRENGTGIEQVIRYRQNLNGEITAIDTVGEVAGGEGDKLKKDISSDIERRHFVGGFGPSGAVAEVEFIVDSETVVFLLPNADEKSVDSKYAATNKSHFGGALYYNVEGYDMEDGCLKVCVLQNIENWAIGIPNEYVTVILEDVTTTLNVRGEETYKISGIRRDGKMAEAITLDKDVLRERDSETGDFTGVVFKKGDIVRWYTNSLEEIVKMEALLASPEKESSIGFNSIGTNANRFYATYSINYGYLTKKSSSRIVIDTKLEGGGTIRPFELAAVNCFVVDMESGDVTKSTMDELNDCINNPQRRVGVVTRNAALDHIVIYKFD